MESSPSESSKRKSMKGIFLGYSLQSKEYRAFNKRISCMEETIYVIFYEDYFENKE